MHATARYRMHAKLAKACGEALQRPWKRVGVRFWEPVARARRRLVSQDWSLAGCAGLCEPYAGLCEPHRCAPAQERGLRQGGPQKPPLPAAGPGFPGATVQNNKKLKNREMSQFQTKTIYFQNYAQNIFFKYM